MTSDRAVDQLINIGKTIAGRLKEVGIITENDLRRVGPVGAHQRLQQRYPDETLPVCYYLYSFEGALHNKHWNEIGDARKKALKQHIGR